MSQDLDEDFEVIVVDDGSSDPTPQLARAASGPVTVISQSARGPAAARNLGVARTRSPKLAFCDADVFPAPGWLRHGAAALERATLVQGRVLPDPQVPAGPFDRTIRIESATGLWEAANLFVTRELFTRAGGFGRGIQPRRGKQLGEDVQFGWAAIAAGARTEFCAAALAYHAVFPRGPAAYVAERCRLRFFPALARDVPSLRREFFYRDVFLDRRSARFDLALAGCAASALARSPLPLLAGAPYLRSLAADAARGAGHGPPPALVAGVDLAADAVSLLALLAGSVRERSPLL
jgi:glycosyltransferase involved in cell wall biosynthesis